jgi:hypothetical protein
MLEELTVGLRNESAISASTRLSVLALGDSGGFQRLRLGVYNVSGSAESIVRIPAPHLTTLFAGGENSVRLTLRTDPVGDEATYFASRVSPTITCYLGGHGDRAGLACLEEDEHELFVQRSFAGVDDENHVPPDPRVDAVVDPIPRGVSAVRITPGPTAPQPGAEEEGEQ